MNIEMKMMTIKATPIIRKIQGEGLINSAELRTSGEVNDSAMTIIITTIAMESNRKTNRPLSLNLIVKGINREAIKIALIQAIKQGIPIFEKGVEMLKTSAMTNEISKGGTILMIYFSKTYCFRVNGKVNK